ncbi:LysM peptidoglycan-binding domain-containing protein [Paenisporosarcina antarctica]|uniref:LysM peptidoglycan-binding domain-containing protein n=1 Tax=Paenisporosarcina antarctica TaxID=417367 RepID=A0A4P6ZW10_9BACL|nr:LysM peptidoglycan-binding domain-containing protein [Paenisporosarcina antarctica]QBP40770.1 LysM peptidoglycan-binding domain-containing protein [Paenisporosarcina antarctica]
MSNLTRKQKEIGLIVLSSLFCLIMIAYAYFTFYVPKKESLSVAETTLTTDRQTLFALEQQLADQPEIPIVSSLELQKKVPIDPLTELIILQIEKAEVVSKSLVQSIGFSEGPFVIEAPPEGVETLQQLLVNLSIETSSYATLEAFIDEIEKLDRILIVDNISFSSPGEVTTEVLEPAKLQLSLSFTAFYRPDLLELLDEGPKVDTPAPADKSNPLPSNEIIEDGEVVAIEPASTITETVEASIEASSVTQAPTTKPVTKIATAQSTKVVAKVQPKQKYKTYTVKPGDTLFSISMQHYGTRLGEEKIKVANDLPSNKVMVNETLIIPY